MLLTYESPPQGGDIILGAYLRSVTAGIGIDAWATKLQALMVQLYPSHLQSQYLTHIRVLLTVEQMQSYTYSVVTSSLSRATKAMRTTLLA